LLKVKVKICCFYPSYEEGKKRRKRSILWRIKMK